MKLQIEVPAWAAYLSIDRDGYILAHENEPAQMRQGDYYSYGRIEKITLAEGVRRIHDNK